MQIKMSRPTIQKLKRYQVGGLPLVADIIGRMRLREILDEALQLSGREAIRSVETLTLLVINLVVAKDPLYELADWVDSLDLKPLGFEQRPTSLFSDDRFGRALDKRYQVDRASLQTQLVLAVVRAFDVKLDRIHNDNTHIQTWEYLHQLHGRPDFLYVADGKLCTRCQLSHIADQGGRAITIVPQPRNEAKAFLNTLRAGPIPKKPIWRRPKPGQETVTEYFSLHEGSYRMDHGGYSIHWFLSSEKRKKDRYVRQKRLIKAEAALRELAPKLNARRLKTQAQIKKAFEAILVTHQMDTFIDVHIVTHIKVTRLRPRGRPPGEKARYRIRHKAYYSLQWKQNIQALQAQRRVDGVFPLLCTDENLHPREVLKAWKYQPRLEKRFEQLKHVHRAAPLLFKKIERVEANMFIFFVALMVQALLEREVRTALKVQKQGPLKLYPEERDALHPTTSQILKTFADISTYRINLGHDPIHEYTDPLKPVHQEVLALLGIKEYQFWNGKRE
jgi:hypothetical protein